MIGFETLAQPPSENSLFEVETEMALQALEYDFVITAVPIRYRKQAEGSSSKLKILRSNSKNQASRLYLRRYGGRG
jgi:hypothetical protein